ncbi:DUF3857 domain-containing protein [uncultured Acetobacteroides sp.]|uniref:DUF3857 domain-containing protein n=1 Tax=uncultured Acetobacteroides sp. TaxID=1760811 RepID=UPI0029F5791A|nr:DUF3857 domain-containing protein [uncultured Acetobacteroides sp.]
MKISKGIVIGLLLGCLCAGTRAQDSAYEFGRHTKEEFEMKSYAKDPSAEAVVLHDIGSSHFLFNDRGLNIIFERRMKIKVLSKAGIKWAQLAIPYYADDQGSECIEEVKGNTYNFENEKLRTTALNPENSYVEKINKYWSQRVFAMPDVKVGSVIEVAYTVRSPFLFNLRGWKFQQRIPVVYSEYTTRITPNYNYTYIFQGAPKPDSFKSYADQKSIGVDYNEMVYEFAMRDVPAFRDEAFVASVDDYLIKIDFQLVGIVNDEGIERKVMATWDKLVEDIYRVESFGRYLSNSQDKAKTLFGSIGGSDTSQVGLARQINQYVKRTYSWNGHNDKFASKSVKEFLLSKTGNSADINLFLAGMLKAAGIEAYPVLISTREHGKLKLDYPFEQFFNSVIVLANINKQPVLLDATDPLCDFAQLPIRCISDKGLVANKKKPEWAKLTGASGSSTLHIITINPMADKDSSLLMHRIIATGYDAVDSRSQYASSYADYKAKITGNIVTTDSLRQKNLYQVDKPFELAYSATIGTDRIEDKLVVNPFCNAIITNPLKQDTRSCPVDMAYRSTKRFFSTIVIPEGYKLMAKPEDLTIDNPIANLSYRVEQQEDGSVRISGAYTFKKDIYPVEEYSDLKAFFKILVDKFSEKIILQKI